MSSAIPISHQQQRHCDVVVSLAGEGDGHVDEGKPNADPGDLRNEVERGTVRMTLNADAYRSSIVATLLSAFVVSLE